jgi:hypothetical protein
VGQQNAGKESDAAEGSKEVRIRSQEALAVMMSMHGLSI